MLTHQSTTSPVTQRRVVKSNPSRYATDKQTAEISAAGSAYKVTRMSAADMLTTDQAAKIAGVSRVTINAWIKQGKCIGLSNLRRGFKLPEWQFDQRVFDVIQKISEALGSKDGWALLSFLENSRESLGKRTPLAAILEGTSPATIINLALTEGCQS
jgi:DNA-binding XRE family transcriptional regulator